MERLTENIKKAYDDYYLVTGDTVYTRGIKSKRDYVSPYKEDFYFPSKNIKKRECYNKLGKLEDVFEKHNVNWEALDELLTILEQGGMVALRNGTFYRINIAEPDFKGCVKIVPLTKEELERSK